MPVLSPSPCQAWAFLPSHPPTAVSTPVGPSVSLIDVPALLPKPHTAAAAHSSAALLRHSHATASWSQPQPIPSPVLLLPYLPAPMLPLPLQPGLSRAQPAPVGHQGLGVSSPAASMLTAEPGGPALSQGAMLGNEPCEPPVTKVCMQGVRSSG